jgi:phage replication-related protein YjqB (UPF0714/DUF867 family)
MTFELLSLQGTLVTKQSKSYERRRRVAILSSAILKLLPFDRRLLSLSKHSGQALQQGVTELVEVLSTCATLAMTLHLRH